VPVKPNLVVVDIDGTVNRLGNAPPLDAADSLMQRLAQLNLSDDTEVVWLSWWPRDRIARLNQQLDLDFRILPLGNQPGGGKRHPLRIELLRANRERVAWLDDDEAAIDEALTELADLLVLQPDFSVGLTPLYLDSVVAYLDGADEAQLIAELVEAESWRWTDRVKPKHSYSRRTPTRFDKRGAEMRKAFLDELAAVAQRAEVKPRADESYGTRDGVRIDPWQLEDAVHAWAEHGLAIEFRPLSGRPGEIQLVGPQWEGADDGE